MKTPGITVRPIQTMDGGHEVNEVFFDDVKVPVENLVGEENRGWDCAKFLLGNERTGIARVGYSKQRVQRIKELARQRHGRRQAADRGRALPREGGRRRGRAQGAGDDADARARRGPPAQGPACPIRSRRSSRSRAARSSRRRRELLLEIAGPAGAALSARGRRRASSAPTSRRSDLDWAAPAAPAYFNYRKTSIYGGSNEIQRNILAKAVLGF